MADIKSNSVLHSNARHYFNSRVFSSDQAVASHLQVEAATSWASILAPCHLKTFPFGSLPASTFILFNSLPKWPIIIVTLENKYDSCISEIIQ